MKTKVYKLFFDYEKEERWLNKMSALGLHCIDFTFGRYLFEEGAPGEYTYRIELLDKMPSHPESRAYIKFLEDAGIECVATHLRWVYFRQKTADGPFEIYSDYNMKIAHYKRICWLIGVFAAVNLLIGSANMIRFVNKGLPVAVSALNLAVGLIFTYFFALYLLRIRKLKKEKRLHQ